MVGYQAGSVVAFSGVALLCRVSLQGLWRSVGQRSSHGDDACAIARACSFTLLSVQGVFM